MQCVMKITAMEPVSKWNSCGGSPPCVWSGLDLFCFYVAQCFRFRRLRHPLSYFPKPAVCFQPDGRFEVRDADREGSASEFVGTFHSLWLTEVARGIPAGFVTMWGLPPWRGRATTSS